MQHQKVTYTLTDAVYPWSTNETDYGFHFTPFKCTKNFACCPNITYALSTTNEGDPTLVDSSAYSFTNSSDGTKKVLNILDRAVLDINGTVYYIYASSRLEHEKTNYDVSIADYQSDLYESVVSIYSGPIRWKVICGPHSVQIEEGAWPAGYIAT